MQPNKQWFFLAAIVLFASCGQKILRGSAVYEYSDLKPGGTGRDSVKKYIVDKRFRIKLTDKTGYFQFSKKDADTVPGALRPVDTLYVEPRQVGLYLPKKGKYYTNETGTLSQTDPANPNNFTAAQFERNKALRHPRERADFATLTKKFSLSALAVPLKFRGSVGNDSLVPPTVETGFNVNFAPAYRYSWSFFNPDKEFLNSNTKTVSITVGGLLGLGTASLKATTNAVGIKSDRTAAIFTYGGVIIFGFNNIGFGYSFGFDNVLSGDHKYWKYQNRLWHGVTVSLDLIK